MDADIKSPFQTPVVMVEIYDLRTEITGGTSSFSKHDVINAKNIVINELKKKNIDKYNPDLKLIDNKNSENTMIIHVIYDENVSSLKGSCYNRTFFIKDGKITHVESYK